MTYILMGFIWCVSAFLEVLAGNVVIGMLFICVGMMHTAIGLAKMVR